MIFEIGDRVRYADDYAVDTLRVFRTSRGTVRYVELPELGNDRDLIMVQWDNQSDMTPENADNIVHVDAVERLAGLDDG